MWSEEPEIKSKQASKRDRTLNILSFDANFKINNLSKWHGPHISLSKRSDGHSLRVASNLLIQAGEIIKAKTLALQAVDAFEKTGDTKGLELMLKENDIADEVKQKVVSILE